MPKLALPNPDAHGNFWLSANHITGPVIYPHKVMRNGIATRTGTYTAYAGPEIGFLCEGIERLHFSTARQALAAIQADLERMHTMVDAAH